MVFCRKCGAKIGEDDEFCKKCGGSQEDVEPSKKLGTPKKRISFAQSVQNLLKVGLIIMAIMVIFALLGRDDPTPTHTNTVRQTTMEQTTSLTLEQEASTYKNNVRVLLDEINSISTSTVGVLTTYASGGITRTEMCKVIEGGILTNGLSGRSLMIADKVKELKAPAKYSTVHEYLTEGSAGLYLALYELDEYCDDFIQDHITTGTYYATQASKDIEWYVEEIAKADGVASPIEREPGEIPCRTNLDCGQSYEKIECRSLSPVKVIYDPYCTTKGLCAFQKLVSMVDSHTLEDNPCTI
ncbi:MAG: hypothetical protein V1921_04850 [Candidatus Altiarchaeota archaeon]